MSENNDPIVEKAREAAQRLAGLRERVGERLSATRADVRELWTDSVEPAISRIEEGLTGAGEEAITLAEEADLKLQLRLLEARERWEELREDVEKVSGALLRDGERAVTEIDLARVKARLARMDAQDALERRADDARRLLESARSDAKQEARELLDKLGDSIETLRAKLDD